MFRNIVSSLIQYERIETTLPKAKDLRRIADKMITLGKQGDMNAKKQALSYLKDPKITIPKLFGPLSARFADRPGGYTRVIPLGRRYGDNAPMAVIEYVDGPHDLQFEGVVRRLAKEQIDAKAEVTNTVVKATKSEVDATKATKWEAETETEAQTETEAEVESDTNKPTRLFKNFYLENAFLGKYSFLANQFLGAQTLNSKPLGRQSSLQNEATKATKSEAEAVKEEAEAKKKEAETVKEEAKQGAKERAGGDKRVTDEVVRARWAKKVEKVKKARGLTDEELKAEVAKEVKWLKEKQEKITVTREKVLHHKNSNRNEKRV
ncbi:ribosomal protein L17 [Endogone sp. FLAS-F59071]|nr:ribosomal protein L17 [Endogone sp. FLAS-F59071]|eukprot:RUS22378.1 ribosomal protein L17 [Endogone sp. FLAS-F59071]